MGDQTFPPISDNRSCSQTYYLVALYRLWVQQTCRLMKKSKSSGQVLVCITYNREEEGGGRIGLDPITIYS